MQYTDTNGDAHDLPKLTRSLAKRIDSANDEQDADKAWKAKLAIVQECLGDDSIKLLDGTKLDDVDISVLETTFEGIVTTYDEPKRAAQNERIEAMLSSIDFDKLQRMAEAMDSINGKRTRQGFKAVK